MFQPVDSSIHFPRLEEETLAFWRDRRIYEQSLERRRGGPEFVFYEGPPTANGLPHPGHCLTRAIKDLFPRYRTMRGFYCERKAGWDTHGLPVEVEVCKELGIHSKEEIEAFGVEPFIHKCQQSVWRYMKEWERLTERLGFWIKLSDAYVTYHQSYVESVWWSLKNLFERGLLYRGHKILWWWAQGGTALSSGEVGQGYRSVADPSVFVLFPLLDGPRLTRGTRQGEVRGTPQQSALLVWTTTPWTLPSNQFAAVHPEIEYAIAFDPELNQELIFAADLVEPIGEKVKRKLEVRATCRGSELIGLRYRPPFDFYYRQLGETTGHLRSGQAEHVAWRIVAADFVTTDSGSGAVHEAPAFGEVDYELLLREQARFVDGQGPTMICAVAPNGRFTHEAPDFAGQWVKDADKPILRSLRDRGLLYHQEQYVHEYPFCWRAEEDPLIQYPRETWFIRTTQFRDAMIANNKQINWLPEHIRDGRFGNFLESNVDWALSRERYWGTPLPIWVCDQTGQMEAIASYAELLAKPGVRGTEIWAQAKQKFPDLAEDLKVHKPYIDHVTYDSPYQAGGRMRRVSEVIDCWYDSGAMPFAQWGYPHANRDSFERQFPANFISEALDQTRGWFYSLLAISTLTFPDRPFPHPFENCIVLGLMLAEWWEGKDKKIYLSEEDAAAASGPNSTTKRVGKMSKQLRNYRSPQEIFDTYGADALRWYFFANQPPWTSVIYSERTIKESIPEFLLRLWNVYSFFVVYGNIDRFDPAAEISGSAGSLDREILSRGRSFRPVAQREELDRWILSELDATAAAVIERMDAYDNFAACQKISAFVEGLSNWYVRRSRDRFWSNDPACREKLDAYWTLYECLVTTAKMIAPFVPFVSEAIWRNLAGVFGDRATESVHWCEFPQGSSGQTDSVLLRRMGLLREIASLGRSARSEAKLRVRQPLKSVTVILNDAADRAWLEEHGEILRSELKVLRVDYASNAAAYVTYKVQPNFKLVGPRVGRLMPQVKEALSKSDGGQMLDELNRTGKVALAVGEQTVELSGEEIQVLLQAKPGRAAAQGPHCVAVLDTELTPQLIRQGMANDAIRLVQDLRKERNLQYTDRIRLALVTKDAELMTAISENAERIQSETLATRLDDQPQADVDPAPREVSGRPLTIFLSVAP
jgi:isoleucyl-tRNA synthetase